MDITMRIVITKNQYRGWSSTTYTKYSGWPNDAVTHEGHRTLTSALWHKVLRCVDLGAELLSVTVKGEDMPFSEVWKKVDRALAGGPLAYVLPDVRKLLEVTDDDTPGS